MKGRLRRTSFGSFAKGGGEGGDGVAPVGDDADVGGVEDRRVGVGVDREHGAGGAHADRVVELAARADAHEEAGRDRRGR